jgi:hypothetical protein
MWVSVEVSKMGIQVLTNCKAAASYEAVSFQLSVKSKTQHGFHGCYGLHGSECRKDSSRLSAFSGQLNSKPTHIPEMTKWPAVKSMQVPK